METCGDNRFEIIAKAKAHLLDATNIDTSEDEMKVLDSFLFRCWQMGWLDRYDRKTEPTISKMEQVDRDINVRSKDEPQIFICACETCKHRDEDWNSEACDGCCENNDHYEPKDEPFAKGINVRSKESE